MREKLKSISDRLAALLTEERSQLDRIKKEGLELEGTEKEQYEKRAAEIDKVTGEREEALRVVTREERNARLMEELERPLGNPEKPEGRGGEQDVEVRQAWLQYLRSGQVEKRSLMASDDAKGGFLAPKQFIAEMIKSVTEMSPMRALARVRLTSSRALQIPKRTSQFSAVWVGETEARPESTGLGYGLEELPTHTMSAIVLISEEMIEDAAFNMEAEIREEISEQFAVAEASAFVVGDSVKKPWGIAVDTAITNIKSGSNGDFNADALIDLLGSLKGIYQQNATFGFNRTTFRKIRKLKINNEYVWQPLGSAPSNISYGWSGVILDRPYVIMPEMANTGTTGAVSVLCGDIRRGYTIADRVAVSILRDPFTVAGSGQIKFVARKRVGGQVVLAEAINRLEETQ